MKIHIHQIIEHCPESILPYFLDFVVSNLAGEIFNFKPIIPEGK